MVSNRLTLITDELTNYNPGESRSLKRLCDNKDDLIGLIAYGIYKTEQSEWAKLSMPDREEVERLYLSLQSSRVENLRAIAEKRLAD